MDEWGGDHWGTKHIVVSSYWYLRNTTHIPFKVWSMNIEKKRRKHEACHTIKENKLYKEKRMCMLIAKYAHEYRYIYIYANYIRTLSIIVDT